MSKFRTTHATHGDIQTMAPPSRLIAVIVSFDHLGGEGEPHETLGCLSTRQERLRWKAGVNGRRVRQGPSYAPCIAFATVLNVALICVPRV
jgi:hypothetical protein